MGTASGLNRRKYHALLIASTRPPVDRVSCLAGLEEEVIVEDSSGREVQRTSLGVHRYSSGTLDPKGVDHLVRFEKTPTTARWIYRFAGAEIVKELRMAWRRNGCAVRYYVRPPAGQTVRLRLSPCVTLRDFHTVNRSLDASRFRSEIGGRDMLIEAEGRTLHLRCDAGAAQERPVVLRDVLLDLETERRQEDTEDLFIPGYFEAAVPRGAAEHSFVLAATLAPDAPDLALFSEDVREQHLVGVRRLFVNGDARREALFPLVDAADEFLVPRIVDGRPLTTVLAGFPWFSDWGRDTMISLIGLMLVTRRFEDARGALETFARFCRDGLIPNLFDDYGGPPQYNTVDASLWFLHASTEYLAASDDRPTFDRVLLPACLEIIDRYRTGTHFNIRMDPADGLIESGDETTQLTWMDAKRDGIVFTPRHGKPVEINALWHHGLRAVARAIADTDPDRASELRALADHVAASFRAKFWCGGERRLYDCLQRDAAGEWRPIPQIRPNQIFAVSLADSPLTPEQQRGVVACVTRDLLTPFGLRTLSPRDPAYCPRFDGDMMSRDRAYHNGTVWPWLIGAYCEALLRVGEFSAGAKQEARAALQPLLNSITTGCLGQIAEVYDAEPAGTRPRRPQGCMAQAWSMAEALRAAVMTLE
jgi:predicted glycogen debranching enzyme